MIEFGPSPITPENTPRLSYKEYLQKEPIVRQALEEATKAHAGQMRKEGTPYIRHPEAVGEIMYVEWGIINVPEIIAAGLLHDTVEDTDLTLDQIRSKFGDRIAFLVDAVSKFGSDKETVKKVFEKTLVDPWVAIIKLGDRLHNMRTLQFMKPEKQIEKGRETLDVYAPLAESLGMWTVKTQLEDLSLQYTDPELYQKYLDLFNNDPRTSDRFISHMQSNLDITLVNMGIEGKVAVRKNSLFRLKEKKHPFGDISDVVSFRIMVNEPDREKGRNKCYQVIGKLREIFMDKEDQSRYDDFFTNERFNKYSAIQITLDYPFERGTRAVEIAVTTKEKEDYNNWGIVSQIRQGKKSLHEYALKLVFMPSGKVKFLPPNATGLDLAYLDDRKTGAEAIGMIVNGKKCSISTVIPNSADVEILRDLDQKVPNREDVRLSHPNTQKKAEKQFLEEKIRNEEKRGKEKVVKVISEIGLLDLNDLTHLKEYKSTLDKFLNQSAGNGYLNTLYRLVEYGVITEKDLRQQLANSHLTKTELNLSSIFIEGNDGTNLLGFFSGEIGGFGGNIRWAEGGSIDGKTFDHRFVVEKLTKESEKKLKEIIGKNPHVKNVIIV